MLSSSLFISRLLGLFLRHRLAIPSSFQILLSFGDAPLRVRFALAGSRTAHGAAGGRSIKCEQQFPGLQSSPLNATTFPLAPPLQTPTPQAATLRSRLWDAIGRPRPREGFAGAYDGRCVDRTARAAYAGLLKAKTLSCPAPSQCRAQASISSRRRASASESPVSLLGRVAAGKRLQVAALAQINREGLRRADTDPTVVAFGTPAIEVLRLLWTGAADVASGRVSRRSLATPLGVVPARSGRI